MPILDSDFAAVDEITKADPQWRAAMARRGYDDLTKIRTAPITAGAYGPPEDDRRRMVRVLAFVHAHEHDLAWAHPIDGVVGRRADGARGRTWRVISTEQENRYGRPTGYTLYPESAPVLLADPASPLAARAGFAANHLWVTRYDPAHRYPAGDFVNQHRGGGGSPPSSRATRTSTAPTSCCGTRSVPPMSRGWRTGRSCRPPTAASSSSRPASSTAIQRWTSRRPARTVPRLTGMPETVPPADHACSR
jgi:Cu2+-containing amine oxidase